MFTKGSHMCSQLLEEQKKCQKVPKKDGDPTNVPKRGGRGDTSTRKCFLRLHKVWGFERETVFCLILIILLVFTLWFFVCVFLYFNGHHFYGQHVVPANQIVFKRSGSNMVLFGTTVHQSYAELWLLRVSVCWSPPPCLPGSSKRPITQLNNTLSIVFCC